MKKSIFCIASLVLFSTIASAQDLKLTEREGGCNVLMAGLVEKAYSEPTKFELPIFSEANDKTILEKFSEIKTAQTDLQKVAKLLTEFSTFATPLFRSEIKDGYDLCLTFAGLRFSECGSGQEAKECDEKLLQRADVKVIWESMNAKFVEKIFKAKNNSDVSTVSTYEQTKKNVLTWILDNIYSVVVGVWVAIILMFFVMYRRMNSPSNKVCPKCHHALPKARIPTDVYEIIAGGWTCQNCGQKLTAKLEPRF